MLSENRFNAAAAFPTKRTFSHLSLLAFDVHSFTTTTHSKFSIQSFPARCSLKGLRQHYWLTGHDTCDWLSDDCKRQLLKGKEGPTTLYTYRGLLTFCGTVLCHGTTVFKLWKKSVARSSADYANVNTATMVSNWFSKHNSFSSSHYNCYNNHSSSIVIKTSLGLTRLHISMQKHVTRALHNNCIQVYHYYHGELI